MGADTNEANNEPWKCTGGLEYGGFHPEVINYQDQCQFCNRHRNELLPINSKQKKNLTENIISEEKSFLKKHIIAQFNRYKYPLIALIASALGLNNETLKIQLQNLVNQSSQLTPEVTTQVTSSPTQTPLETTTPTPPETPENEIKPPMIITGLPDNQEIIIKAGSSQVIDKNIALSPTMKSKIYQAKVNETTIFNFKLNPITKEGEILLNIIKVSGLSKTPVSNSKNGELKDLVLESGAYLIEVNLIENQTKTYQLTISQK